MAGVEEYVIVGAVAVGVLYLIMKVTAKPPVPPVPPTPPEVSAEITKATINSTQWYP